MKPLVYRNYRLKVEEFLRKKLIRLLLCFVKKKDSNTISHCTRVMKLAVGYAKHYKYSEANINTIKYASLLHDFGKVFLSTSILTKPDKLNGNEIRLIQKHPLMGYYIIRMMFIFKNEALLIKNHHERIDGCGYPLGLKGYEIDDLSKILSVCDAFDAMTSNRIYSNQLSFNDALRELLYNAGSQFDKETVHHFYDYINKRYKKGFAFN